MEISLIQYLIYLKYMFISITMLVIFAVAYVRTTPIKEFSLIKTGNLACALSFGGALMGFCIALASSIANNVFLLDFILWGMGAALLQIGIYFVVARLIPNIGVELENNNVAVGTLMCFLSLSLGIANAACLA